MTGLSIATARQQDKPPVPFYPERRLGHYSSREFPYAQDLLPAGPGGFSGSSPRQAAFAG